MKLSFLSSFNRVFTAPDIAIDLGTANTRLYASGHGLIADEPSRVKFSAESGTVEAIGNGAVQRPFTDHEKDLVSPLRQGVVANVEAASALLHPLFKRAHWLGLRRPRVLACAPTDAREEEREALIEATRRAGASAVALAPEPLAAAIGIGMDVASVYAQMIVDIGDGVTDIAVIRSGSLVATSAVRIACSDLITSVCRAITERHNVEPYHREAERLIWKIGAGRTSASLPYVVAGADCKTGSQRRVYVHRREVTEAMVPILNTIVSAVRDAVKDLPPEIGCEVIESGIHLTGGGACLPGMADLIAAETHLDVHTAKNPLRAVINGARQMLVTGAQTEIWAVS
jgi:rod shape-determining protein MreB